VIPDSKRRRQIPHISNRHKSFETRFFFLLFIALTTNKNDISKYL